MSATIRCLTTSRCPRWTNATPSTAPSIDSRPEETGPAARHVDLGDVAGHDRLRAEADPGQEHLHLLGAGVLGLVEDDEAPVRASAPHEGKRRHLDRPRVQQALAPSGPSRS